MFLPSFWPNERTHKRSNDFAVFQPLWSQFLIELLLRFSPFGDQDGFRVSVTVKRLPASTRLAKANSVNNCAVFFARPR